MSSNDFAAGSYYGKRIMQLRKKQQAHIGKSIKSLERMHQNYISNMFIRVNYESTRIHMHNEYIQMMNERERERDFMSSSF